MIRRYNTTETGLIVTKCPIYDCVIGGWHCVNCPSYKAKDKTSGTVECTKGDTEQRIGGLPPVRQSQKNHHKLKKQHKS